MARRTFIQVLMDYIRGEDSNTTSAISYSTLEEPYVEERQDGQVEPEPLEEPIYTDLDTVSTIRPGEVHLHGTFKMITTRFVRAGMRVTDGLFSDNTGAVRVVWFRANVAPFIKQGVVYELRGKFELKNARLQVTQPDFRKLDEGCQPFGEEVIEEPVLEQPNIWTSPIDGKGLSDDSKWKALRTKVFQRDKYTCVVCGARTN